MLFQALLLAFSMPLGYLLNRFIVSTIVFRQSASHLQAMDMLTDLGGLSVLSAAALSIEAGLTAETALTWLMLGIGFQLRTIELYRN